MCDLNAIGGCGIVAYEVLRLPQPFIAPISKTVPNTPISCSTALQPICNTDMGA